MCIRRKSRIQTSTVSDLERISIIPDSSLSEPVTAAAAPSSRLLKRGISARERLRQRRQKQSQQQEKPG
ncbi:MAG: hypothetical protein ACRD8W_20430 [Nitrososphaeraceae archaeon]